MRWYLHFGVDEDFWDGALTRKEKKYKLDFIKIKNFHASKDIIKKMKR